MVRNTLKQQVINRVEEFILVLIRSSVRLKLWGMPSERTDELLYRCNKLRMALKKRRYLFYRISYRKRESKFHVYLDPEHADGLNDREFKFHFRMSRDNFHQLVEAIKDHPSFARNDIDSRGKEPRPAEQQLLVLLKYFGSEGNSASSFNLGAFFGISNGAVDACRRAALVALLTLEERTYFWPSAEERKLIATRIKEAYLFLIVLA